MKNKIKKWHIALMSFMALFIAIFASLFSLRADTVDEETGEVLTDNWELNTVFYDSTVDNGKTPLTEINWDASDGGYGEGTPRVITVQINYKNNSAVTMYQPNELKIIIPNLANGCRSTAQLTTSVIVGANDSTHTGYDWNFTTASTPSSSQKDFTFINAKTIEEKTNFEGSIQIAYTITPAAENTKSFAIEKYEDTCIHNYSKEIQAVLSSVNTGNLSLSSNVLNFNYTRTYTHLWEKFNYGLLKTASKIQSFDFLGGDADEYIWVKYTFNPKEYGGSRRYPYIYADEFYVEDVLENCKVIDADNYEELFCENSKYIINMGPAGKSLFVGYPKSIYNATNNNLSITNTGYLYAKYLNSDEFEYIDEDSVTINLENYAFSYSGNLYSLGKRSSTSKLYYEGLIGKDSQLSNSFENSFKIAAMHTGKLMDVKFGDDLLKISSSEGTYKTLNSNEYYFSEISFPGTLLNGHEIAIPAEKYDIELWVRYGDSEEYTLYDTFKNTNCNYSDRLKWSFTETQNVSAYYFVFKDLNESLIIKMTDRIDSVDAYTFNSTIKINRANEIAETGKIYNFCYLQVFFKDENGNAILQNESSFDNYSTTLTEMDIATYDQVTYGTYMQRSFSSCDYIKFEPTDPTYDLHIIKTMPTVTQDSENECFCGKVDLKIRDNSTQLGLSDHILKTYFDEIDNNKKIRGYEIYDLLPIGMELTSTSDEIINSLRYEMLYNTPVYIYDQTGKLSSTNAVNLLKKSTSIEITPNYNNTGRTLIHICINLSDNPIIMTNTESCSTSTGFVYTYNYKISYDSFLEHGNVWTNRAYATYYNQEFNEMFGYYSNYATTDNGLYDLDETDINANNNTTEKIVYAKASATITSVVSTHQDVTTFVKTDQSNYSTGIVDASCNSEYEYKLRVRTGSADVTNLVIYTSIEEAQPERTRWKGEFLDIDTTYAENKGYTIKVWYSENTTVSTLTEDTSWQVYDEATVDKSKVKSLAFQYLVETDETTGTSVDAITPATLPANSLTYVLIRMKSPADESIKTLARMDCWTQWNALDDYDQPVDFITGINSNVVKVALPNSIKADDLPSISLKFIKEIQGETSDFENLNLNKADEHIFMIRLTSLTANDDGTYNQVTGLLSSTQGLVITKIPTGTYLLEELRDNYFEFVNFTDNNDPELIIEGVTFEKTDQGYIITVSEDLSETVEFNIKVTNKTEDERFYEDKEYKENLFLKNKIESGEDPETPI